MKNPSSKLLLGAALALLFASSTAQAAYSASHQVQNGDLVFARSLTLRHSTLPVTKYASCAASTSESFQ